MKNLWESAAMQAISWIGKTQIHHAIVEKFVTHFVKGRSVCRGGIVAQASYLDTRSVVEIVKLEWITYLLKQHVALSSFRP